MPDFQVGACSREPAYGVRGWGGWGDGGERWAGYRMSKWGAVWKRTHQ
jgi:hypothetical protein